MKTTTCGHEPYFAKGLCEKCYNARPEVKAKKKEYRAKNANKIKLKNKEYNVKHKNEINAWAREYQKRKRERLIAEGKITPRKPFDPINEFVETFFNQFNQNNQWQKEGIEKMANLYATTTCELTKTQQCKLEEKILQKAKP